ncbi:MAG: hypothetical protein JW860_08375 [Sedimentisphaerales bacterium]|nr:hypothetical protein [Sedimentisphaerales bacterium]
MHKYCPLSKPSILILTLTFIITNQSSGQFRDDFNELSLDPTAENGWAFYTGDGAATVDLQPGQGYATMVVNATRDQRNIWWAVIRRHVSNNMDLELLGKPNYELRIEARLKASHAPRRVNLSFHTQRTTDYHSNLMEFDIPDTTNWHTISMTTRNFDARPGDQVSGQMAMMDWGLETFRVNVDYIKADIVNVDTATPDQGVQVPYHPNIPDVKTFAHHIPAFQDSIIDREYTDMNFNNWSAPTDPQKPTLLAVSGTQYIILRWDLSKFTGREVPESGLLELTTHSLQRSDDYQKDFGMIRLVEITAGNPQWDQKTVTWNSFRQNQPLHKVLNPQLVIDFNVNPQPGDKNCISISKPVLQRLINGQTKGLALKPSGAVNTTFYALENQNPITSPKLHLNLKSNSKN